MIAFLVIVITIGCFIVSKQHEAPQPSAAVSQAPVTNPIQIPTSPVRVQRRKKPVSQISKQEHNNAFWNDIAEDERVTDQDRGGHKNSVVDLIGAFLDRRAGDRIPPKN